MADKWAQYAEPASDDKWAKYAEPQEGAVSRFVSNAAEQANPVTLLKGMGDTLLHPIEAAKGYMAQNADLANKTGDAFKHQRYLEGVRHGLNLALNVVPGLGAAADAAGDQINAGDVAGGLGKATGAGLAVVEGSKLPAVARGTAEVLHATPSVVGAAVRAGAADVAGGALKAGTGAAVQALPVPESLKFGAGFEMGREGIKQVAKGVKAGFKAGAEVAKQRGVIPPTPAQPEVVTPHGQPTPEMAQQANVPFTPEEQALADHVMAGVEPQPPAAPPIGSDYVMPEPAPPQPAGRPNVGDPRLATPPVLPPPTFPQPEAPPPTEPPAVNLGSTVNPPAPASTPAVRPADPSAALGAFGVDEPLVLNRAKVKALAKDNGISEWDQLKMLRDQGIKIQDDPFMSGETQRNRRGKVTSPEPMKPQAKPAAEIELHRGGSEQGNYYSTSRDFAREFTHSGRDSEVRSLKVPTSDILDLGEKTPGASDVAAVDAAKEAAKSAGKRAFYVDEGQGQPRSVFMLDKEAAPKPPTAAETEAAIRKQKMTELGELLNRKSESPLDQTPKNGAQSTHGKTSAEQGPAGEVGAVPGSNGSGSPDAAETRVRVPGQERSYQARYQVRELADVQPSHNGNTFQANPRYKLRNDRDYSRAENQGKVISGAAPSSFEPSYHITDNPDATNGPVVIDSEGHALGGNGRTMILQRVYQGNPKGAAAYRDMLTRKAGQFGIDPEQVGKMKQPVLVREIADAEFENPRGKQDAVTDFNKKGTAELRGNERAIADSRRVSTGTLDNIAARLESEGPNATLADILKGKGGPEVLNRLIEDGVVSPQERAAFADGDALTKEGHSRISKLMLGRFFRDPAQLDAIPQVIKNKLERIAAPLAKAEGAEGWNLTPKVQDAIDLLEEARAHGASNIDDFLKQSGLFGDQRYSPEAVSIAKNLKNANAKQLTDAVRRYAEDASFASEGPGLFGDPPTPEKSFSEAFPSKRAAAASKLTKSEIDKLPAKQAVEYLKGLKSGK